MEQDKQTVMKFASIMGKKVEANFDGGVTSSDGGVMLLRKVESRIGIVDRIVGALCDGRHQSYIAHSYRDLIRQRVFQIACGYEDANDSNTLRCDPALKAACERLPITGQDLASQPTLSRLENSVSRRDLYRVGEALVEAFIASYEKPPKKIVLDIDDTDDPTHGGQQLSLFHGYFDTYCYMPVHVYEGHSGKLITALLRPGRRMDGRTMAAILKRVLNRVQEAWPKVRILLRGDGHFSAPEVHELCEEYRIDFLLGQMVNKKLKALGQPLMDEVAAQAQTGEAPVRLFTAFDYQAKSWKRPLRIVYKAEMTHDKANPRFVVTNIRNRTPKFLYEKVYCARGRTEGFIKNHKTYLHSDRTSCHRFSANQFRVFLHSAAYVLLHTLKASGMKGTTWVKANFDTIQLRILKIGARVREQTTVIRFHFPTSYPDKDLVRTIIYNLDTA